MWDAFVFLSGKTCSISIKCLFVFYVFQFKMYQISFICILMVILLHSSSNICFGNRIHIKNVELLILFLFDFLKSLCFCPYYLASLMGFPGFHSMNYSISLLIWLLERSLFLNEYITINVEYLLQFYLILLSVVK